MLKHRVKCSNEVYGFKITYIFINPVPVCVFPVYCMSPSVQGPVRKVQQQQQGQSLLELQHSQWLIHRPLREQGRGQSLYMELKVYQRNMIHTCSQSYGLSDCDLIHISVG